MSIFVIGLNYRTAPLALREKIYFEPEKLNLYLQDLLSRRLVNEAVLLSTCNRSELYCEADDAALASHWFISQATASRDELNSLLYIYRDEEAVAHMMKVAAGLDSMVLGETEILGQMKTAFSESCAASAVDALFHRLFQNIFSLAKDIRSTTAVGACPVSVASAAVHFAKQQIDHMANANIALIGAGDTTALLIRYLKSFVLVPMTIVNRNVEKAALMMAELGGHVHGLNRLPMALARADIVFSATGSITPLVTKEMMQEVMLTRQGRPITLIDIAVPRDIEANVADVPNVHLFCIDDLKAIIEKNKQGREHAADKAFEMIKKRSREFFSQLSSFDKVAHTIRAYRGQIEEICHTELSKAKQQLEMGIQPEVVLETFARLFTNKLLHSPSVQLRQWGAEGRFEVLQHALQLFETRDPEVKAS